MKRSDPRRSAGWRSGSGFHKRIGRKRRDTDDKLVNSKASTHTKGGSWRSDIQQDNGSARHYGPARRSACENTKSIGMDPDVFAADSEVSLRGEHGDLQSQALLARTPPFCPGISQTARLKP
ncbi:hypothetical protein FIBSPDRAFT_900261 [Athelia psychrophila]|uniref:Uncharacterized protein n=1 Tax=Athelia psychrophila TaxID=1759441 RepID=A0A165YNU3_9AGAM|nr:hypothetical protein FIBSPDRAFT_900261 [Fibularhizoctonia sp. CBS 109695]